MDFAWFGTIAGYGYLAVLSVLCVYGLHRYFLVWTFYRVRRHPPERTASFHRLPHITVQLPMYNEPRVARRVIEAAAKLDYPRDRLEVQVLDDSTDETAQIAAETIARLRAEGHDVVHVRRSDRTGYKAGALAEGLKRARGEFILIFDADFVPPTNLLRESIHYFTDPLVGMVQCRWDHLNRRDSLLTQAQAILLDGHFLIEHTARNRSGRYMSFNGTAGIWRRAAIEDAGGWQHDTLTEDLDLSYRAQLRGWRFVFLPELTAPAELPPEMFAFKAQQHRWTKGGAQTCLKLLPKVLASPGPWYVKLEAFFHLTSCLVYVLMVALSLLIGPALLAKLDANPTRPIWQWILDGTLFFIGTGSALSFYVVSQRALPRRWPEIAWQLPGLLALGIGIAFNNACAAIEGLLRPAGEFVRTPKYGDNAGVGGNSNSLRRLREIVLRRGQWKAWAELGIALYMALFLLLLFGHDHWIERISAALPFLGLFIVGYAYVALESLLPPGALRRLWSPRPAPRDGV